jgi:hypothetical protein
VPNTRSRLTRRRLCQAAGRATTSRSRKSGSQQTLCWRKADSNPRSHSHESFCRGAAEGRSRNDWLGSRIKLWSSREMAIGCAPSPRPVHGRDRDFESRLLRQRARTFATARSGRHRSSKQPSSRSPSTIALPIPNQAGNRERGGAGNSDAGEQAQHQPPIALLRLPPRI